MEDVGQWRRRGDGYTLLASGYAQGESGLGRSARLWVTVSDHPLRKLMAVSPFFEKGGRLLVDSLDGEAGPIRQSAMHTDAENVMALSKGHYGTHAATRRLHLIPKAIGVNGKCVSGGGADLKDKAARALARATGRAMDTVTCRHDGNHAPRRVQPYLRKVVSTGQARSVMRARQRWRAGRVHCLGDGQALGG